METGKSHNVLSASWRSKKANRVIQAECEALETRCGDGINSKSRAGKDQYPSSSRQARNKKECIPPFSSFFVLPGPQQIGFCPPTLGEGNLVCSVYCQFKC